LNKLLLIFFIFQANLFFAQEGSVGSWRDHLPYSDAVSVTEANGIIYCATKSALFTYDKVDFSIERLNIVNGLSDIGLSKVKFNAFNSKIVVAYRNGNIDIIDEDKSITNLPAIKITSMPGSKEINHIYFQGSLAYLSTGFGIVVLNTEKIEIVETYFFGPLGSSIVTNGVTIDDVNIYAATDQGVFYASKNSANLIDFNAWSLLPELGVQNYSSVVLFSNRLFASLDLPDDTSDTLYYNDGGLWQKFILGGLDIKQLVVTNNVLSIIQKSSVSFYNSSLVTINNIASDNQFFIFPNGIYVDAEGVIWLADNYSGLIRVNQSLDKQFIIPNAPFSKGGFQMDLLNDEFWMVSGGYDFGTFAPSFIGEYIFNHKEKEEWKGSELLLELDGKRVADAVSVVINPNNTSEVFIATWGYGLLQLNNGKVSTVFTAKNSVLDSTVSGNVKIGALAFDKNNNLWISNSYVDHQLTVKTADNKWYSYALASVGISSSNIFIDMIIDENDNKWIIEPKENSIVVFNHGTLAEPNTIRSKKLTSALAGIPGTQLYTIAEDKDGEIWVGTDAGVAVFYNPSSVFDEDIKAEQIYVEQDGQTQLLLETETVTSITIDGANRKWIGTQTSGVFLMSEDGTRKVEHFTTQNSPLFSNNIFDIVIDPETGEVYIGTEKGLISYKGTATEGGDNYDNVFVYPNPVKPDFTGVIAIRGLLKDTDIRITDISGNIVYQTTSFGGQAVWDGRDFNGNKVQTGVYMIFNGSEDGSQKAAAKVLIYH